MTDTATILDSITVEGNQNVKDLFAMTPYYWKTSQKDMEKLDSFERLETEVDIIFAIYKKIWLFDWRKNENADDNSGHSYVQRKQYNKGYRQNSWRIYEK